MHPTQMAILEFRFARELLRLHSSLGFLLEETIRQPFVVHSKKPFWVYPPGSPHTRGAYHLMTKMQISSQHVDLARDM